MNRGTCKHYNGSYHNKTCDIGVCYRDVTPKPDETGSAYREPCRVVDTKHGLDVLQRLGSQGTCDKYEEPSDYEISESVAFFKAATERMMRTLLLMERIKKEHKGESWQGVEKCPECKGALHLSHASINGHVWGQCETEGCLSWME